MDILSSMFFLYYRLKLSRKTMLNKITNLIRTVYQNYFELGAGFGALIIVCMAILMDKLLYLHACPLCIMTRYLFLFLAMISFTGLLTLFLGLLGVVVNLRQIYIQNLSAEEIAQLAPNCGMPLETQIEFFGFFQGIMNAFQGGPTCAEDGWRFIFNFSEWALIFFIVYITSALFKILTSR
jgi:disulfide bond formation protein DsbB